VAASAGHWICRAREWNPPGYQETTVTHRIAFAFVIFGTILMTSRLLSDELVLALRSQQETPPGSGRFEVSVRPETWIARDTAVIVCDVWDLHHCLNAVRRLEEFAPRLNDVLKEARRRGATIIHAPSDCMPAYEGHPARKRAMSVPAAGEPPQDVTLWCSQIPAEEKAAYPIDQSDGGEDDDPAEHALWAAKLTAMGRNPGMPWKSQSKLIEIDAERDFISDRGDEIWNLLESRRIRNVILTGVHTNMCVLGRPFGLRQMKRHGRNVVLMRDMTDCMYNPKRWPFVDHFTGNDLIISHVERFVCPTVTSDQLLGGQSFRFSTDRRPVGAAAPGRGHDPAVNWTPIAVPGLLPAVSTSTSKQAAGTAWYRCTIHLPDRWLGTEAVRLSCSEAPRSLDAWLNGEKLIPEGKGSEATWTVPSTAIFRDDVNLLVLRVASQDSAQTVRPPVLSAGQKSLRLQGRWQVRLGDDAAWSNMPLPAKFGGSPEILFQP
jgi:nicotinamidase-related amidase